jgi:hypothetical protein
LAVQLRNLPVPSQIQCYRLGDGVLDLRTDDPAFLRRFNRLYADSVVESFEGAGRVLMTTRSSQDFVLVSFDDPDPPDPAAFIAAIFPDRGFHEVESPRPPSGWRIMAGESRSGTLAFSGGDAVVEARAPWQRFMGNLAVNRVLRLQRDTVFFHAASAGIRGRGILLVGPKESGKTTLSLAIAARGHEFLGDETAGVRLKTREIVPVRRTPAIRPGPAATAVRTALAAGRYSREQFPDGSVRVRARGSRLFPRENASGEPSSSLPLGAIVFLRSFSPLPVLSRLSPGREHLALLTPLACSLWDAPPARRALELAALLGAVPSYMLNAGEPEATAELLDHTLEAQ